MEVDRVTDLQVLPTDVNLVLTIAVSSAIFLVNLRKTMQSLGDTGDKKPTQTDHENYRSRFDDRPRVGVVGYNSNADAGRCQVLRSSALGSALSYCLFIVIAKETTTALCRACDALDIVQSIDVANTIHNACYDDSGHLSMMISWRGVFSESATNDASFHGVVIHFSCRYVNSRCNAIYRDASRH